MVSGTTVPALFAFHGRVGAYTDSDTGLVRMGARDYAPALGRFVSRDPSGYLGGVNLYTLGLSDPVNYVDPDGNAAHVVVAFVGGLAFGAIVEGGVAYLEGKSGEEIALAALRGGLVNGAAGALVAALGPGAGACLSLGRAMALGAGEAVAAGALQQGLGMALGERDGFSLKQLARDGLSGAVTGGVLKGAKFLCFPGDTPVQMASVSEGVQVGQDGSVSSSKSRVAGRSSFAGVVKPISSIRVGDLVASRDEATGKLVSGKVTGTSKRVAFELYEVSLSDASTGKVVERIRATREHPFYVVGKGWVAARYLGVGNSLVTRAGPSGSGGSGLVVSGLKRSFYPQGVPVYNFEVEATHSYFVGRISAGFLVHNGKRYIWDARVQRFRDLSTGRFIRVKQMVGRNPFKGDPYPGMSHRQTKHTSGGRSVVGPTNNGQYPSFPHPGDPLQPPSGMTADDVLQEAWKNPAGWVNPDTGAFSGVGVGPQGPAFVDMRVGGDGVHGWYR